MQHDEIEIKLDLSSENNYLNIIKFLTPESEPIKQENYFFDSSDKSLASIGWVLRIRKEADNFSFTAKGRKKDSADGLTIREEIEEIIDSDLAIRFIEEGIDGVELPPDMAEKFIEVCRGQRLEAMLSFVNYRSVVNKTIDKSTVTFAIDRTEFYDGSVDYEFEAELSDKSKYKSVMRIIEEIFARTNVPVLFQNVSKFGRALKKTLS